MAKNDNLKDFLKDVADAIRDKKGTTGLINPQDFSAEIASIQSGGGAVAVSAKAVNFRDYDGTILHSYTKDEFLALTELPPLPTREGLICQEWNRDFADAVEYVTEYGVLEVGATYITDDGKTRLYISVPKGRQDVPLYINQTISNGVTIDWGDGSATETLSGTGNVNTTHHFYTEGVYRIVLSVADGCILGFGHLESGKCIMGETAMKAYSNSIIKAEIGSNVATLDNYAFYYCYSLKEITIPKGLVNIGAYCFYNCNALRSIILPKGEHLIAGRCFYGCSSLDSVALPYGSAVADYAFYGCYSLRTIIFPSEIGPLNSRILYDCRSLASVVLPKLVTTLNAYVFYQCYSLASIKFSKSINSINSNVFKDCYSMVFYDFSESTKIPSLANTNSFTNIPSDCKIIVPDAIYDEWIAATNWSTYASNIIKKSEWDALNA